MKQVDTRKLLAAAQEERRRRKLSKRPDRVRSFFGHKAFRYAA